MAINIQNRHLFPLPLDATSVYPETLIYKAKAPRTAKPTAFPSLPTSTTSPLDAAPEDVGEEAATWLVTVNTVAGTVDPATVDGSSTLTTDVVVPPTTLGDGVCDPGALAVTVVLPTIVADAEPLAETVVPPTTVCCAWPELVGVMVDPPRTRTSVVVCPATVLAGIVVAATVVVYVTTCPRAVAGIALPTPAEVYGVGRASVAVFGASEDAP